MPPAPFGFDTYYWDATADLYAIMGYGTLFDPVLGESPTRDRLGQQSDLSGIPRFHDDPINRIDPTGMSDLPAGAVRHVSDLTSKLATWTSSDDLALINAQGGVMASLHMNPISTEYSKWESLAKDMLRVRTILTNKKTSAGGNCTAAVCNAMVNNDIATVDKALAYALKMMGEGLKVMMQQAQSRNDHQLGYLLSQLNQLNPDNRTSDQRELQEQIAQLRKARDESVALADVICGDNWAAFAYGLLASAVGSAPIPLSGATIGGAPTVPGISVSTGPNIVGTSGAAWTVQPFAESIIGSVAQQQANLGAQVLRDAGYFSDAAWARYMADPAMNSRYFGTAVHNGTADALEDLYPGRFRYNSVGPDFLDQSTGEVLELTTPGQVNAHIARFALQGWGGTAIVTYQLP